MLPLGLCSCAQGRGNQQNNEGKTAHAPYSTTIPPPRANAKHAPEIKKCRKMKFSLAIRSAVWYNAATRTSSSVVERLSYTQLVRSSNLFSCIDRACFPIRFGKQAFLVYPFIFSALRSPDLETKNRDRTWETAVFEPSGRIRDSYGTPKDWVCRIPFTSTKRLNMYTFNALLLGAIAKSGGNSKTFLITIAIVVN